MIRPKCTLFGCALGCLCRLRGLGRDDREMAKDKGDLFPKFLLELRFDTGPVPLSAGRSAKISPFYDDDLSLK